MAKIIILGAGLTGLSAAYHLEQNGFFDYKIYDKEDAPGGLCRSVQQDGFTFDYTGHLLHINDPYMESFSNDNLGKKNFNTIVRRSFIQSHDTFIKYPFQINLYGLPSKVISECIEGFVNRPQSNKDPKSFHAWVMKHFGAGLAKHFFTPFQSKILAYDIKKITPSWTGRFVPKTSLTQMIDGALGGQKEDEKVGYNSTFFYPQKGGISYIISSLVAKIKNQIQTGFEMESIDLQNKVVTFTNGDFETYDHLINTIPLDNFLKKTVDSSATNLNPQHKNLVCNSVFNFNLGINRADLTTKHWIYFPEGEYPFYRLGFPHNFAKSMAPAGCSSLYGECAFVGQTDTQALLANALDKTKKILNLNDNEIITQKIITIPRAYVLYTFWREKNLPQLLNQLEQHAIYSIGRYGGWKYSSMQESILDGQKVAQQILSEQQVMPSQQFEQENLFK
ncbi:NAD(P)-binding protein [bacterium]|jgi:protoporphyrinogen oxidase|nr:NAD(P)-binding protein [bacterium]MBT5015241.1 NAD(P)-binding protein [bacterium]